MYPVDDDGKDVAGTDETTRATAWITYWWNRIEEWDVNALVRRWARHELASLMIEMPDYWWRKAVAA